ncbi:DDE superfamily endonuclease [Phytophthora infestans]|uniref:DDE superfamily endonuclease n=1 Tax=Phytophthora infestans TaxID=4787 RepID=A0A833SV65_PHYIN|nr:DDE superfamily endonuclease [Phytophthora infestans]
MANGLIILLYGPVEGRRHDGYMLRASEIEAEMRKHPEFLIYGDQSYPLRSWLIVPYAGAVLTNAQKQFNFDLSKARIAVE